MSMREVTSCALPCIKTESIHGTRLGGSVPKNMDVSILPQLDSRCVLVRASLGQPSLCCRNTSKESQHSPSFQGQRFR